MQEGVSQTHQMVDLVELVQQQAVMAMAAHRLKLAERLERVEFLHM
jgi:hypothetical protein